MEDGYYWFRMAKDGCTTYIGLLEYGEWFVPGVGEAVPIDLSGLLGPVERPDKEELN